MAATCPLGQDLTLTVGVNRARTAPAFSDEDKRLLQALLKHVQRALQLRRRFDTLVTQADAGTAALDRVAFGVVMADAEGRTILVNSAAAALCRANVGLRCKGDKISAVAASETLQFLLLIRDAAQGGAGGAIQLTIRLESEDCWHSSLPLPRRFDDAGEGYGRALIAFRRSGGSPAFAERVLIELFGLSRAEPQVVRALAEGAALEAVAAQRGVKVSTLRTQLESIFRKTGVENQRDLLRLLGSLPQIR
jgi:DNA-binding CsgD family transcriptional regulator